MFPVFLWIFILILFKRINQTVGIPFLSPFPSKTGMKKQIPTAAAEFGFIWLF